MYSYPLRALSKKGGLAVPFTLGDGPCRIDDNYFILTERPGSPLLRYDMILRGMDIPGIFEGDILLDNGKEFVIQYQRGFMAVSKDKEQKSLSSIPNIQVVSNIYKRNDFVIPKLLAMMYKIRESDLFELDCILGVNEGNLILNYKEGMLVPEHEIKQYAGITYLGNSMYFGDEINGNKLMLRQGRCAILDGDKYLDIAKKIYL